MRDLTEIRQQIDQIDQKMLALFKAKAHTFLCGCSWQQGGGAFARYPLRQDCYYQTIRSVWRRKELLSFVALFAAVFD